MQYTYFFASQVCKTFLMLTTLLLLHDDISFRAHITPNRKISPEQTTKNFLVSIQFKINF